MSDLYNFVGLSKIAATVSAAMGISPPEKAEPAEEWLSDIICGKAGGKVDRVLMFNPDAIAMWLYQKYTGMFAPVLKHACLAVPYLSPVPPVTPVCFATMYTGASPAVHGIRESIKPRPVIRGTDTLFDALLRAGKRVAIVAANKSSIANMFLEREIDYYPMYDDPDDRKALETALGLIEKDRYDFITVYGHSYDSVMHKKGPEDVESLVALKTQIDMFDNLAAAVEKNWGSHRTLITFSPDHGVHMKSDGSMKGTHGLEIPEDLNTMHFYGVFAQVNGSFSKTEGN